MLQKSKTKCIGILTSGGDCPGLNAAIRGVAKAAMSTYGMTVIGIHDGFQGLVRNDFVRLDEKMVSGILTLGGTILGTSRDKPHRMLVNGQTTDMTEVAVENARRMGIECLVCLGGGGTIKNAYQLLRHGLNVMTLPKTIDNDIYGTDITFGFDTALAIATEAVDRLHTTATSHHRMILCEIMGHKAGWLALGAGIAGGADVILIPEVPYDLNAVATHLLARRQSGKRFSIIAAAEGALSIEEAARQAAAEKKSGKDAKDAKKDKERKKDKKKDKKKKADKPVEIYVDEEHTLVHEPTASRIARQIQKLTGFEARVTSLGHVQRGGTPSARDRLLCSGLGAAAATLLAKGHYNCLVAVRGQEFVPVPLEEVVGKTKLVYPDHPWVQAARLVGSCLGD